MTLNDILHALTPHARPGPNATNGARIFPSLLDPELAAPAPVPRDPLWDVIERRHREATQRLTLAERVYQAKSALHGGDWEP